MVILAVALMFVCAPAQALDWAESPAVSRIFSDAGVAGTFVLYDPSRGTYTGHDRRRAKRRYIPASTFKVPNTLIGLSVGAVSGVDEVLPYGGKPQPFKAWEKDMSLREAIKASNVPVYQELARRTGLERMRKGVRGLRYGNGRIGKTVDEFWLRGPLKVSAAEQAEFLCRLAQGLLPFPEEAQERTREISLFEPGLWAKTGWVQATEPQIGWWVGWVKREGKPYCFALNVDMAGPETAAKRVNVGKAALGALGFL
jgi:beta-lactamase class D